MSFDLSEVVRAVDLSSGSSTATEHERYQATLYLETLKNHHENHIIGMQLFITLEHCQKSLVPMLFALQLIRCHLSMYQHTPQTRASVRQVLMQQFQLHHASIDPLIGNSIANNLALCIKHDYPELWPSAFEDVFYFTSLSLNGMQLVVNILSELDHEVVMYNDKRSPNEVTHNMIIKDEMRKGEFNSIVSQIVQFLYTSSVSFHTSNQKSFSIKCLEILIEYVGWIDINIAMNKDILLYMYSLLQDTDMMSVVCRYLLEIIKKGMSIENKIALLESISLVSVLNQIPLTLYTTADTSAYDDLGALVDMLFLTLIGHAQKAEESLAMSMQRDPVEGMLLGKTFALMNGIFPLLLRLFHDTQLVICPVMPSLNRYTSLLKQQIQLHTQIQTLISARIMGEYFEASVHLTQVLLGIFKQIQYESDFDFDSTDEDDIIVIEAKKEVRKLFVNCCRVRPASCLELIFAAFQQLSQPLSTAAFPPLDAALRLLHALAECGSINDAIINSDTVRSLVAALHQSDVKSHAHPQVLLAYFEVCVRYVKQSTDQGLLSCVDAIATGLVHAQPAVRNKSAVLLLKILEAIEGRSVGSVVVFLPMVLRIGELLFPEHDKRDTLSSDAELQLIEVVGLVLASEVHASTVLGQPVNTDELREVQRSMLVGVIARLTTRLQQVLSASVPLGDSVLVAHYIHCFTSISKKFPSRSRVEVAPAFLRVCDLVGSVLTAMSAVEIVRQKCTAFLHRMITLLGPLLIPALGSLVPTLVHACSVSDADTVVQLCNQSMLEFGPRFLTVIEVVAFPLLDHLISFCAQMTNNNGGELLPPHVEVEYVRLVKLYSSFVLYLFSTDSFIILLTNTHQAQLSSVFNYLLQCLRNPTFVANKESRLAITRAVLAVFTEVTRKWKTSSSGQGFDDLNTIVIVKELVPFLLVSCVNGAYSIQDAQTIGVFADVGALLWTLSDARGAQALSFYLQSEVLDKAGWSTQRTHALVALLLGEPKAINIFKDDFKLIFKLHL